MPSIMWCSTEERESAFVDTLGFGMTKDEFFHDPIHLWYSHQRHQIETAWFGEAWRTIPAFRGELTYELGRDASKLGEFLEPGLLALLAVVLNRDEVLKLYEAIYARAGNRESDWREAFEQAFPQHVPALPPAKNDDSSERWGEQFEWPA